MRKYGRLIIFICFAMFLVSCSNNDKVDSKQTSESGIKEDNKNSGVKSYEELKYTYQEKYLVKYMVDIPDYVMSWNIGHCIHLGNDKMILFDKYMDFGYEDYGYKLEDFK